MSGAAPERAGRGLPGDAVAGAALAGLGAWIVTQSLRWDLFGPEGPGPGFFPLGYGTLMVALSLVLVAHSVRRAAPRAPGAGWREHERPLATWLAFAAAALAIQWIGFALGFALLTAFVARYVFARPWRTTLLVGALCPLGFLLVFPLLLGVRLPAGPFGF